LLLVIENAAIHEGRVWTNEARELTAIFGVMLRKSE
jgi:hypothetical protein